VRTTPDGRFVLQSHFDLLSIFEASARGDDPRELRSALAVIDAGSMQTAAKIPLCPAGHGMAVAPDGSAAYVTCWGSDELAIVPIGDSPSSEAEVVRVPIEEGVGGNPEAPFFGPYAATITPDGAEVWVSNLEGTALAVYNVEAGAFDSSRSVDLTGSPLFASFSAEGDRLYVPTQNPDQLVTVDPATGEILATLDFDTDECDAPHGTLPLAGGERLAVVCEGDHLTPGTVVRMDLTAEGGPAIEQVFEVGVYPDDLILIPEAQ
jgi:DNA-binding beta-propeller fold protein YncE